MSEARLALDAAALTAAVRGELVELDHRIDRRGLEIWLGAEPTFTRREAQEPWWLWQPEGGDKEARARAMLAALARRLPRETTLHRVVGRHYPDEDAPRFCWGAHWSRAAGDPARSPRPSDDAAVLPAADADYDDRPPISPAEAWLTVTPDPGVVEINQAPAVDGASFLAQAEAIWAAAADAGLAPLRYRYNGDQTDSGGGGQLTLGGPTPESSPFFRHPDVLPGLIRYLNNHPSLSYWFIGHCVGSAGQAPRADEGVRERWEELPITVAWLEQLADRGELTPEVLWSALAPLLVDAAGNSHRAEINVEKLWNPHLPGRGMLGVLELRAFRMAERPTMMAAAAALVRAIVARLAVASYREPLIDWGADLHDRWALPCLLADDLRQVLGDLDAHGLGLGPALRQELAAWREGAVRSTLGDTTLEIRRAVEFWPLVGDVASQERASARLVDASLERLQITVHGGQVPEWIVVDERRVRLHEVRAAGPLTPGELAVALRRRAFVPSPGFHPGLPAQDPVVIEWAAGDARQTIELYAWIPGGGYYEGLPVDDDEAAFRRQARVIVRPGGRLPTEVHRRSDDLTVDLRLAPPRRVIMTDAVPGIGIEQDDDVAPAFGPEVP